MSAWWWLWLLTAVGVTGFILAGRKVWWAWYVNIACQFLWLAYALITAQYGFIVASAVNFVVFTRNAIRWTREHRADDRGRRLASQRDDLVAQGVDPADLLVPIHPDDAS